MKAKKSDNLLSRERLSPPKIDLARLGKSSDLDPFTLVQNLSPDEFEIFIYEWLFASERYDQNEIYRLGGAGDKGRDLLARDLDGNLEQFQCKRYKEPLTPTHIYSELGKLCYYSYRGEIETPKTYWIVASHDVGSKLCDLLREPEKLKAQLLKNWTARCQKKITDGRKVELTGDFRDYVERFDFSIVKSKPIMTIINEYWRSHYRYIRFGGDRPEKPKPLTPPEQIAESEPPYLNALLEVCRESGRRELPLFQIGKPAEIPEYFQPFIAEQRDYFYSFETIRRAVRDAFTENSYGSVDDLCESIYEIILTTYRRKYETGKQRLYETLDCAAKATNLQTSPLYSDLRWITPREQKGICHHLVNDKRLNGWVNADDDKYF